MGLSCIVQLGPKGHPKHPHERKERQVAQTHTGRDESAVPWPQARECWQPPQAARSGGSLLAALRPAGFQTSSLQHCEGVSTVALSHLVCGNLSQQPWGTNTSSSDAALGEQDSMQFCGVTVWTEENRWLSLQPLTFLM